MKVTEKDKAYWPIDNSSMDIKDIIDGIPVGVALISPDLRIHAINRALESLTGFNRKEAYGVPCRYIMRNNLCPSGCPAKKIMEKEDQISMEGDIINLARQKVPVMINFSPLNDHDGKLIGVIETIEDISLVREFDQKIQDTSSYHNIIGHSPQMEEIFKTLQLISQTDSSVLITGETGTGKDLVAEAIHLSSMRAKGPFIKINCGALPENLLESELFGHKRGAFTGAVEDKQGRFRMANNGTIYLTEIGDLPLSLQVKLLTFLDDKEFYPLGSNKPVKSDARVIAATHRDLNEMVRQGTFREDLMFRLKVIRIELPPLRERGDDIRLLMNHFLQHFSKKFNKQIKEFSLNSIPIMLNYTYPGNVRELRNIVEFAVNLCQEEVIKPEHLPSYLHESMTVGVPMSDKIANTSSNTSTPTLYREYLCKTDSNFDWDKIEQQMIIEALAQSRGNRTESAKLLGWGRATFYRKLKKYKLG
ncbi:MAG: sigma 54-interacting transcriptional regulator [Pseudomonadota bacterium]